MNQKQYEPNPFLRKLDEINEAKKKWAESEWILTLLRSEGSELPPTPTDEELLQWMQNLN